MSVQLTIELADVSRQHFINALSRFQVSPIQMTPEELTAEVYFS